MTDVIVQHLITEQKGNSTLAGRPRLHAACLNEYPSGHLEYTPHVPDRLLSLWHPGCGTLHEESANLGRASSELTSVMKDVGIGKETGRDRGP